MARRDDTLTVTWEVDDGYCGGAAPQHTQIEKRDIQDCETLQDAMDLVEQAIEDDFRNHANPSWKEDRIRQQVQEVWDQRKK